MGVWPCFWEENDQSELRHGLARHTYCILFNHFSHGHFSGSSLKKKTTVLDHEQSTGDQTSIMNGVPKGVGSLLTSCRLGLASDPENEPAVRFRAAKTGHGWRKDVDRALNSFFRYVLYSLVDRSGFLSPGLLGSLPPSSSVLCFSTSLLTLLCPSLTGLHSKDSYRGRNIQFQSKICQTWFILQHPYTVFVDTRGHRSVVTSPVPGDVPAWGFELLPSWCPPDHLIRALTLQTKG